MKRGKRESLGNRIEELVSLKNKAKSESDKYREMYITETVKEAQSTVKRLTDRLNALQSDSKNASEESIMKTVDDMFSILFEERRNLDKIESDYTFWSDVDKKFND